MTTLSVTTSNSTNIPLKLLGSTINPILVPSASNFQDDLEHRVSSGNKPSTTKVIKANAKTHRSFDPNYRKINEIEHSRRKLSRKNRRDLKSERIGIDQSKKMRITVSDKSAMFGDARAHNMRLAKGSEPVIDTDKFSSKGIKIAEIPNTNKRKLSMMNIAANNLKGFQQLGNLPTSQMYSCLVSTSSSEKLKKRVDSPVVPKKKKFMSHIPVGMTMIGSLPTSTKIKTNNQCKKNIYDKPRAEISLKENFNRHVSFEVENNISKRKEAKENSMNSENFFNHSVSQKIDDKYVVQKIKTSLKTTRPLKRITIANPCSVSREFRRDE